MKTKSFFSIALSFAMLLSVLFIPAQAVSAEPEGTDFEAQKLFIDFSDYDVSAGVQSLKYWSIQEEPSASGGRYLKYSGVENQTWKPVGMARLSPDGSYGNMLRLEPDAEYSIKIKYKITGFEESSYASLALAIANCSSGVLTSVKEDDNIILNSSLTNTDDWAEETYYFTSPSEFSSSDERAALWLMPHMPSSSVWQSGVYFGNYEVCIDYVEIERIEYKPQHMNVDFDDFEFRLNSTNNQGYTVYSYGTAVTETAYWVDGSEAENNYITFNSNGSSNWAPAYTVIINPTGYSTYAGNNSADMSKIFQAEDGADYRISFKYKLKFTGGDTGSVPVILAATKGNSTMAAQATAYSSYTEYLDPSDEWTEASFIASLNGFAETDIRRSLALCFYDSSVLNKPFEISVDDITVDRVSSITLKNGDDTQIIYGAPEFSATGETGFDYCAAETVQLPVLGIMENYSSADSTATAGEAAWFEDFACTVEAADNKVFKAYDEILYFGYREQTVDAVNQAAFCGFDEYKIRRPVSESDSSGVYYNSGSFADYGFARGAENDEFTFSTEEAYTGKVSMYVDIDSSTASNNRILYIGNEFEMTPGQSYLITFRIKKNVSAVQNGTLSITAMGCNNIWQNKSHWGETKRYDLSGLSAEWQELRMVYTLENYTSNDYCAPALLFSTSGSAEFWLDTVEISTVGADSEVKYFDDSNDMRFEASYIGGNTIMLAGREYEIKERTVMASLYIDSRNMTYLSKNDPDVKYVSKTSDFTDCLDFDDSSGRLTYGVRFTGLTENDSRLINVRSYISMHPVGTEGWDEDILLYSEPLQITPAEYSDAAALFRSEGYNLIWSDEFDGTQLDETKWRLRSESGGSEIKNLGNDPRVFKIENGTAIMRTIPYTDANDSNIKCAVSGGLSTSQDMAYRYGYIEMRAKISYMQGVWMSFWLRGSDDYYNEPNVGKPHRISVGSSAEADIFEIFSSADTATPNIHLWSWSNETMTATDEAYNSEGRQSNVKTFADAANLSEEYHVYGFEWTPTYMTMYVDGEACMTYDITEHWSESGTLSVQAFQNPMHVILGSGLFTEDVSWATPDLLPENPETFTTHYIVDYVRLYQKPDVSGSINGTNVTSAVYTSQ